VTETAGTPDAKILTRGFRDPEAVESLVAAVRGLALPLGRPATLMEVCGTHTVAISRSGIRALLRGLVDLRSGPGCPVCVTSESDIDEMIAFSRLPGTVVLTYGDMIRVPGSFGTLEQARAGGADVRVVYSALDAVRAAAAEPDRTFVFLGVGFETTAPGAALAVIRAAEEGLRNFTVYSAHKTLPQALRALLGTPSREDIGDATAPAGSAGEADAGPVDVREPNRPADGGPRVEGFILPGHVSAVIGRQAYDFLARDYGLPAAVTGFEPVDILLAVRELVEALAGKGRTADAASSDGDRGTAGRPAPRVLNLYPRVVREEGNARARAVIDRVFEPCAAEWRGLGMIPGSGLAFREDYETFDAARRFAAGVAETLAELRRDTARVEGRAARLQACRCGDVLRGDILPPDCGLFGRACTPSDPAGPCMVSSEGSCAAYYCYERRRGGAGL